MKRCRLRFSLLTLMTMPAMFAMGWWVRDRNYERDVYMAAEQVADHSGGIYIPELGLLHGGQELEKRMKAMSPEAQAEMARRLAYYEEVLEPTFDPPRSSILGSLKSLIGLSDRGEAVCDDENVRHLGPASVFDGGQDTVQDRIDALGRMRSRGVFEEPRHSLPPN